MFVLALQTEIFDTDYCWIVHLSFLTSHNLLFVRFCKTSKKTTFSVFLSFFLVKLSKSQYLKWNISRTAWSILMILVSFCRILNGLSDEINLLWRCSSPLTLISWKPMFYYIFGHKNDVTTIGKLLHRATNRRRVALRSSIMIVASFLCSKCNRT